MISLVRQLPRFDPGIFGDRIVDIYGGGGVGGWLGLLIGKSQIRNVRVFDNKRVSAHNPPSQVFGEPHVGLYKVDALKEIVEILASKTIEARRELVEGSFEHGDVVFVCVDLMSARKAIMQRLFASAKPPQVVIETRIDTNYVQVYTFVPSNTEHQKRYWQYWFPDQEAVNFGGCNEPEAQGYASGLAAVVAMAQFVKWFGNGERDLSTARDNQILVNIDTWKVEVYQW